MPSFNTGDLVQLADEWAALAKDDDVPDELDPDLQQSINEVYHVAFYWHPALSFI